MTDSLFGAWGRPKHGWCKPICQYCRAMTFMNRTYMPDDGGISPPYYQCWECYRETAAQPCPLPEDD